MTNSVQGFVQDAGVPFDVLIQSLTEQLDKAQAAMALKARVARLPLTFAVKDVSLDLRAFVQMIDDDVFVRPSSPGDTEASTIKLTLTTVTRSMVEENAVDFKAEEPQFSLREALKGQISEEDQRRLERIGVRTVEQLSDLRKTAGTDVVARIARMPVNRLQQALLAAAAPRVTQVEAPGQEGRFGRNARVHLQAPGLRAGRIPFVRAAGEDVPVLEAHDGRLVLAPHATQMGLDAEIDFGEGEVAHVPLAAGRIGRWAEGAERKAA
ncbi:hypothetical protein [Ramlibacter montanisoli]|uniref:Uncharacterized protein n=1 Tax=Ramlibacter montanisoli TaxID=2732512 RepID=A0A849KC76_9BURK|nr:hypothetical protein [Ramlibacter montanisoli]NNU42595.1 hypothetical protein [Ramlibacter montanisoli]